MGFRNQKFLSFWAMLLFAAFFILPSLFSTVSGLATNHPSASKNYNEDFLNKVHALHLDLLHVISPLAIVMGLVFMIVGFRLIRVVLAMGTFCGTVLLGVSFFDVIMHGLDPKVQAKIPEALGYGISSILAVFVAIVSVMFWKFGIFLLGCCGGFFLGSMFLTCFDVGDLHVVYGINLMSALLGGAIIYWLRHTAYIFVTSFLGSFLFYFGLDFYLKLGFREKVSLILHGVGANDHKLIKEGHNRPLAIAFLFMLIFLTAFFSILLQTSLNLKRREKLKSRFTRIKSTEEKSR